ncbi:MAG: class I SAM-dependent methyltransferase [Candidatus Eisenbacteria bacterium]|nr:class I SAM-dependent methyltransferase [Candidatus Eisenbacteria bacterium]
MSEEREQLFDEWAASYDESVDGYSGFPFEGYERVLDLITARARVETGMEVLDLGIGTGNLSGRLLERRCAIWGLDFSLKMLAAVHRKYPQIELLKADIKGDWPIDVDRHFDRVVSAYVLHEFDLESKIRLLRKLVCDHLVEGGRVVVGDISFPTRTARDEAEKRFSGTWDEKRQRWEGSLWDEDEHYWAADETIEALAAVDLVASYAQVSFCGGVYVIEPTGARTEAGCTDAGPNEEA